MFNKNNGSKSNKDKVYPGCKECTSIYRKEKRNQNPELSRLESRKYYNNNRDKSTVRRRKYRENNREKDNLTKLVWRIKRNFGISLEERDNILRSQDGKCAICGTDNFTSKGICIDHNHMSGKIRGILCSRCNSGLGMFIDSRDIIIKAYWYLDKHDRET